MPFLDRELQRQILEACRDRYPEPHGTSAIISALGATDEAVIRNCIYLIEHGLLAGEIHQMISGPTILPMVTITARGLDFLEDDGGLSAILGTVTVRFDDDQFREMLSARIAALEGPQSVKDELIVALRKLPADALTAVAHRAFLLGLESLPSLDAFRKWLLPE